jgi:hypothetical protein
MKKGFIIILMVMLLSACSAAKQSVPQDYITEIASTDLIKEHAGGIQLGDSEQALNEKRGKPNGQFDVKFKNTGNYDTPQQAWEYSDYNYTVRDSKVISYSLLAESATEKGAQLGNSIKSVKELYGEGSYTRQFGDFEAVGYIDKENEWVIEFFVEQEKVTGIIVSELSLFQS